MGMKQHYPTYGIKNLNSDASSNKLLVIDSFKKYYAGNPHVKQLHNHSFFHILLFTKGAGYHVIDFQKFDIEPGMIYFMKPGQVHQWHFTKEADGFILNFSPLLFDSLQISSDIILNFPIFRQSILNQVHVLEGADFEKIVKLLEQVKHEKENETSLSQLTIATKIIELFIEIHRVFQLETSSKLAPSTVLQQFYDLIDMNYKTLKLPKEYAHLMNITPSHLNQVCKQANGLNAGEIIRNRVLLEAKRLLANLELTVAEVSDNLNFSDYSNFTKFFKKYTALAPEAFRKLHYL